MPLPPPVPKAYWKQYSRLVKGGFTHDAAIEIICGAYGLERDEGQKRPWTLAELSRLEFVKWRSKRMER